MNLNLGQVLADRLVRRELSMLATYRLTGRRPRILHAAYWRASFSPLILGLIYLMCDQALGLGQVQAALVACSALFGLILAELQLFVLNAAGWIFAKQVFRWDRIEDLHTSYTGQGLDLSRPGVENRWDQIELPRKLKQNLALSYLHYRDLSPKSRGFLARKQEMRVLGLMTLVCAAALTLYPEISAFILAVYAFVAAWPAKRLKAAWDTQMAWPVLSGAFDWVKIQRDSKMLT